MEEKVRSMGAVVKFPRHARASARLGARFSAESRAIISAVKPARAATSDAKIASHHSEGMRSRCPHLRTAGALAPMSSAIASGEGQSPMTLRNETISGAATSVMPSVIGQSVLKSKSKVSYDFGESFSLTCDMPERMSETEEKAAFIGRVRAAREARFPTQKPMLTILGIDQGTYKQYETRTPLPYRFVPKFCAATGVSLEWLLTGEGQGPVVPDIPRQVPKRMGKARRGRAA
jgi:hypothetical protein